MIFITKLNSYQKGSSYQIYSITVKEFPQQFITIEASSKFKLDMLNHFIISFAPYDTSALISNACIKLYLSACCSLGFIGAACCSSSSLMSSSIESSSGQSQQSDSSQQKGSSVVVVVVLLEGLGLLRGRFVVVVDGFGLWVIYRLYTKGIFSSKR